MKQTTLMLILIGAVCSRTVPGQSKPPITRKVVERHEIPGSTDELEMILIEYAPGAAAAPHLHPVVGLNYIIQGTAESQYEGEALKTFRAGDSYQDPANMKHLIFRNASKTEPLKFLVACKIPKGQSFVIPSKGTSDRRSPRACQSGFLLGGSHDTIAAEKFGKELSVFYRDGQDLVMTHFCNAGNQPRLRLSDVSYTFESSDKHSLELVWRIEGRSLRIDGLLELD